MEWLNLQDSVNVLSLIGACIIILVTVFVVGRMFAQMKEKKGAVELDAHSFDGIGELKSPVPFGWKLVYLLAIIWMIWYFLWGYPLNSYSQIGEYNKEVQLHNAKFEEKFKNLSQDEKIAMGTNLFLVQCSACHGITGDGINGKAQNLNVWGSEAAIAETIEKGSKGMDYIMPEMLGAEDLGIAKEDIPAIAAYVAKEISAIKKTQNEHLVERGRELFANCTSCHGEDGTGVIEGDVMAPNLTIYGSAAFAVDVLNRGKNGFIGSMPKFDSSILNDIQKQAVGEYIISLSRGQ